MAIPAVADTAIYSATYWAAFWGFTLGWGFRAGGRRHLPPTGPVLIAANHQSFLDPVLFGSAANRRLTYLARSTLFDVPILAPVIRHYGAVPIDRGFGKDGLRAVVAELDRGQAVLVFPEGERTQDGRVQPLKAGLALLVKRVTCPIVPAAVAGAFDAWPRHRRWPTLAPLFLPNNGASLAVVFGEPIDPNRYPRADRGRLLSDIHRQIGDALNAAERLRRGRAVRRSSDHCR